MNVTQIDHNMSEPYNLRRSRRKKGISTSQCYLQNFFENGSPEIFNPKVRLERLKVLECYDINSGRFYLEKGRITVKRKESFLVKNKYWLQILCAASLVLGLSLYWQVHAQLKQVQLTPDNDVGKSVSVIQEEELTTINDGFQIRQLVRDYFEELKKKNKIEWTKNISHSFIEDQCKINTKDKFSVGRTNFYNVTYPELTNFTDYALESQGAKIVSVFNTKHYGTISVKFLNFYLWPEIPQFLMKYLDRFSSNGPKSILMPWKKAGDCWAFKGSQGRVQFELSKKIIITAVTIDHIPKEFAPHESIQSAPKKFSVIGVEKCKNQLCKTFLGNYEYKSSGPSSQIFFIYPKVETYFERVEVVIQSNHGNDWYTCVYKIRVHGYE